MSIGRGPKILNQPDILFEAHKDGGGDAAETEVTPEQIASAWKEWKEFAQELQQISDSYPKPHKGPHFVRILEMAGLDLPFDQQRTEAYDIRYSPKGPSMNVVLRSMQLGEVTVQAAWGNLPGVETTFKPSFAATRDGGQFPNVRSITYTLRPGQDRLGIEPKSEVTITLREPIEVQTENGQEEIQQAVIAVPPLTPANAIKELMGYAAKAEELIEEILKALEENQS